MKHITEYPDVLTVADVAHILQIGRNSAYRLVKSHCIRSIRIGRCIRVPRRALEDYLTTAR